MTQHKIFTRDFWLLFVANFVVVAVYFLLMTTMAAFVLGAYEGVSSSEAGLAASIFLVGSVFGRVLCGRYSEMLGLHMETMIVLVVQLVCCILYMVCDFSLAFLMVVRLVHGISFGVANTSLPAIIAKGLPAEHLGEGTGYFMLSNSLALGIGPMIGMFIANGINYHVVFVTCAVASAVAIVCARLVNVPNDTGTMVRPGRFEVSSFLDKRAAVFSVFMFLVACGYSSINTYLNSCAIERGLELFAPFTFLAYSVVLLITRPITGKLMDKRGENLILYVSIVSNAIASVACAVAFNGPVMISIGFFMALGFGTCMSIGQAVCVKIVGQAKSAVGISTFFLLCDLGCGVAPMFWGMLLGATDYTVMYLACALCSVAALIYYAAVHGRKAK